MDLTAFQAALRTRLGVPSSDGLYPAATLTELINSGLHYSETEFAWPWLEKEGNVVTAIGTSSYALPADYRSSIGVLNPDGFPLEQVDAKMLRLIVGASGKPKLWDVQGVNLRLAPNPDAIATLIHVYIGTETDLAAGADLPKIPAVYHNAVVEAAAYLAFRRAHNLPEAGGAKAAYDTWLEQMKVEAPRYSKDTGGGTVPAAAVAQA